MSIIKVEDIAHVRFAVPDLDAMRRFLTDFGLETEIAPGGQIFAFGAGPAPYVLAAEVGAPQFLALGLRAASLDDLDLLAQAEGVPVDKLDTPGGGMVVRLADPDGRCVEVVAGQTPRIDRTGIIGAARNDAVNKPRLRSFVRLPQGPSHVQRLGHAVLAVRDFAAAEAWYKARFGLLTTDAFAASPGRPMGAFMRCDRGHRPSDHHTVALISLPSAPGFLHAGFEVADLDDLMLGHTHLRSTGRYAHIRGIGRHILGSQVFDYWNDPFGNEFEHWTDGDLLTAADAPNEAQLGDLTSVQWAGPAPSPDTQAPGKPA